MEEKYYVTLSQKNREVMLKPDSTQVVLKRHYKKVMAAVGKHIVDNKNIYFKVTTLAIALLAVIMLVVYTMVNIFPYAIEVDGEAVCYVRGKAEVESTYNKIVKSFVPKGTEMKAVNPDDRLSYERVGLHDVSREEVISSSKAAGKLIELCKNKKSRLKFRIASVKEKVAKYTPEPTYIKGKRMVVGETKVKKKGRKGKQIIATTYMSVNGKVIGQAETGYKVIDEGVPAIVYKGILGLPKGEDWRTYDGKPVFKNGKELVKTAFRYKGAPYRYGGYSLTKGIDCVQFVRQMYAKYGIKLPNNHYGLQHSGVGVSYKKAKKGDIICYGNHVGIYIGNGKMINAVHRGVAVSKVRTYKIKTVRRVVK